MTSRRTSSLSRRQESHQHASGFHPDQGQEFPDTERILRRRLSVRRSREALRRPMQESQNRAAVAAIFAASAPSWFRPRPPGRGAGRRAGYAALPAHLRHHRGEQGLRPDHGSSRVDAGDLIVWRTNMVWRRSSTPRSIRARAITSPCSAATPSASTTTTPSFARPASRTVFCEDRASPAMPITISRPQPDGPARRQGSDLEGLYGGLPAAGSLVPRWPTPDYPARAGPRNSMPPSTTAS